MKRLFFLVVILIPAIYAGWPAWSLFEIYKGIQTANAPVLENKVDWPSLRASFKKAIEPKVAGAMNKRAKLSATFAPKLVDTLVDIYMTPQGLAQLAASGGRIDMSSAIGKLNISQPGKLFSANKLKNLFGGSDDAAKTTGAVRKSGRAEYGVDNIKTLRLLSPGEVEVGVALDSNSKKPDLTVVMAFQEFDWKLTKLIPHL